MISKVMHGLRDLINYLVNGFLNNMVMVRSRKLAYQNGLDNNIISEDNTKNKMIYSFLYYFRVISYYAIFYLVFAIIIQLFIDNGELCIDDSASDLTNRIYWIITLTLQYLLLILIYIKLIDFTYLIIKFFKKKWKK